MIQQKCFRASVCRPIELVLVFTQDAYRRSLGQLYDFGLEFCIIMGHLSPLRLLMLMYSTNGEGRLYVNEIMGWYCLFKRRR